MPDLGFGIDALGSDLAGVQCAEAVLGRLPGLCQAAWRLDYRPVGVAVRDTLRMGLIIAKWP